jgi:hypothetical protein
MAAKLKERIYVKLVQQNTRNFYIFSSASSLRLPLVASLKHSAAVRRCKLAGESLSLSYVHERTDETYLSGS